MTGQDAVRVAEAFAERVAFDGIILTKLDGDARGGAALSVKALVQQIVYTATEEPGKAADLTILMEDLRGLSPEAIDQVTVARTIVNGEVLYEGPSAAT